MRGRECALPISIIQEIHELPAPARMLEFPERLHLLEEQELKIERLSLRLMLTHGQNAFGNPA